MGVAEERRERLARMRLYLITGDRGDEVETARIVEAALEGGATVIQLRKKSMPMLEQYRLALALRILTREHEALLIINDHVDLAIAADADGVHLGQDDLPPDAVRALPGFEGRLIGRSTPNLAQAQLPVPDGVSLLELLEQLDVQPSRVVVEHNREIRRRDDFDKTQVHAGDELELVYFVGGGAGDDALVVGGRSLRSRLIHGTGKFASNEVLARCLTAAQPDMITVAIRRLNLEGGRSELEGVDLRRYTLLPNTAGATTAEGAVRLARLARAAGFSDFIKVEVIGDQDTLLPDPQGTLEATRQLVKEGFIVMAYTSDDVVQAIRLYEAGAAAVMPGAAPLGTTLGLQNLLNLELIVSKVQVPVIVDAGLGVPSEAARCLEVCAASVLVNTATARAQNPPEMARAFADAVVAGRRAFRAGRAHIGLKAVASSPVEGLPV